MKLGLFSLLISLSLHLAVAQMPQRDARPRTASIAGRITAGGQPVANARVEANEMRRENQDLVVALDNGDPRSAGISVAVTDGDGRYQITNLAAGRYTVFIKLQAFVTEKAEEGLHRSITLEEGESRTDVDYTLVRGGVITGQVTDAAGRPLIARHVQLSVVSAQRGQPGAPQYQGGQMFETDDRGVYRAFGLRAGRYLVSAGGDDDAGFLGRIGGKYPRTYYPAETDEKQAKVVEVNEGEEVAAINIRLGGAKKTYEALGRVVDDETGQPVPKMTLVGIKLKGDGGGFGGWNGFATSDAEGNFRLTGMAPGQYQLHVQNFDAILTGGGSPYYVEPVKFEVHADNAGGIEMRARRGAVLSGVAVVEGAGDPAIKSKLQQVMVTATTERERAAEADLVWTSDSAIAKINSDGSFQIVGIRPGKVMVHAQAMPGATLSVLRIERDGADVTEGIRVAEREAVTGVRVVLGQGNCAIRGQVNLTGGKLPDGWRLSVMAHREKSPAQSPGGFAEVDGKGRFAMDGLLPGEYTLNLYVRPPPDLNSAGPPEAPEPVTQQLTLTSGPPAQVTMTFDLSRKRNQPKNLEERQ